MHGTRPASRLLLAIALGTVAGCSSPLGREGNLTLQRTVATAVERELVDLPAADQRMATVQEPSDVEETLAPRREQLDEMGANLYLHKELEVDPTSLGPDLTGTLQQVRAMNLQEAILTSVENNLGVQIARLQPAINEADVVAAEAVFDALFFADLSAARTDRPQPLTAIGGTLVGTGEIRSDEVRFSTGIRKPLTSGGTLEVSTEFASTDNLTPGLLVTPNPAWDSAIRLGITQPLLRGFGAEVNTAAIRIARNAERGSIQDLRGQLLATVNEAERAYWDLALAWRELAVRRWLVEVGVQVRDVLARRREFDTTLAQYSDAVARVEQRKADVIRSQRNVRAASDRLKTLLNDRTTTVGSEVIVAPIEEMVSAPISYSLRDAVLTAMRHRPEIHQSLLDIDDSSIREILADNQRLPLLNFTAETSFLGQQDSFGGAYDDLADGDFIEYFLGLALEIPVGNRAAEANFRSARLQRSGAVIAYRRAVQNVILEVKSALRDVRANYELIAATRSNRIAQAENLRALLAEEETLASLTPEFLDLKFRLQDRLAASQFEEVQALVNFDQAVADLYRAMGIGLKMNRIDVEIVPDPLPDRDHAEGS